MASEPPAEVPPGCSYTCLMPGSGDGARTLPATERGRRARALIVDAAATLMYHRGVAATSLDDVLAAAGCGKSQLYHYFTNKADLIGAVIDRQLELVLAAQPGLSRADSWSGISAWAADVVAMHSAPGGPFACPLGTMAAELKNDETFRPQLDAAFRRWEAPIAHGLQTMQDRGELVVGADPEALATGVIAALQGATLLARVRGEVAVVQDALDSALSELRRWAAQDLRKPRRPVKRVETRTTTMDFGTE
jgi:TetR/AcrR family transcriptional regulator, transcriptional repressor for nem operon